MVALCAQTYCCFPWEVYSSLDPLQGKRKSTKTLSSGQGALIWFQKTCPDFPREKTGRRELQELARLLLSCSQGQCWQRLKVSASPTWARLTFRSSSCLVANVESRTRALQPLHLLLPRVNGDSSLQHGAHFCAALNSSWSDSSSFMKRYFQKICEPQEKKKAEPVIHTP